MNLHSVRILVCLLSSLVPLQADETIDEMVGQIASEELKRWTWDSDSEPMPNRHFRREIDPDGRERLENRRMQREINSDDPRMTLGNTGIGPSFRTKRDQSEMDAHAFKGEEDALASAAESVAAGNNAVAAAIETEEVRQSIMQSQKAHEKEMEDMKIDKESQPVVGGPESNSELDSTKEPSESMLGKAAATLQNEDPRAESSSTSKLSPAFNPDQDSHLKKLMSESSELAKELRMVFDILAKRESQLIDEMERLKSALTGAMSVLKKPDTNGEPDKSSKRFRREFATAEAPYKACVYIEPVNDAKATRYDNGNEISQSGYHGIAHTNVNVQGRSFESDYPPEPIIREFIPPDSKQPDDGEASMTQEAAVSENPENSVNTYESAALQQEQGDWDNTKETSAEDVDLSKVYWLKLPQNADEETIRTKVHSVFAKVTGDGKDAIIIPVSRGFSSSAEVSRGFLKAVKVQPAALKARRYYNRKLRSLNIREIH